ncbi:MAG TPA: hypothetical protein PLD25_17620 [Chloroflexota bacterium]|nr:hypothetical protein [Chloroflexota bacterium]
MSTSSSHRHRQRSHIGCQVHHRVCPQPPHQVIRRLCVRLLPVNVFQRQLRLAHAAQPGNRLADDGRALRPV